MTAWARAEFVEALDRRKQYLTGIDFMAHALPARDAVWWGGLCLRDARVAMRFVLADRLPPRQAAVQWVMQRRAESRRRAPAGHAGGPRSVAGGLAMPCVKPAEAPPRPMLPPRLLPGPDQMACTKADAVKIVATRPTAFFLELARWMAAGHRLS